MKKKIFSFSAVTLFLFSFILLVVTSCQRELVNPNPGTGASLGINDNIMVTGGVRGIVIDENNQPVSNATVTSGSNTTTTDRYGVFQFNNINLSKENGYVKVVKPGYFTGTRTFASTEGRIHNVRIQLIPKITAGNFTASTGGTVTLSGGGKLVMPANAITDAGGTAYTGTVNVAMTWIDPTAPNLSEIVPGDLRGITTAGEERGLETYGMLGVELTGSGGQVLKIATGKTAELTFPIPAAIVGLAPASIDLWHFDEVTGRWKQEGTATKTGSTYVAQVSHFSFWNCDAPFQLINLCMHFVNAANNEPLNNASIRIQRPNGSYGYGRTDSAGNLCGKVPKNEALVLQVLDQCNNVVYSQNIGPFSADASLPVVSATIPASNSLTITGTVTNCAGANVTNGAAVIYIGGGFGHAVHVSNGTFSLTILRCSGGAVNFSVLGVDYIAMQQGNPVGGTGTTGTVNVGTVQACGTSSSQFVEFLIDGVPNNFVAPPDNISSFDSLPAPPPFSNKTTVIATRQAAGTTSYSSFTFGNNAVPGTYPLLSCFVSVSGNTNAMSILTPNPMVTVTTFGPVTTGFIQGSFSIQMQIGGTPRNVVCNFRVRRG